MRLALAALAAVAASACVSAPPPPKASTPPADISPQVIPAPVPQPSPAPAPIQTPAEPVPDVEAMSLLGKPLIRPALPADVEKQREDDLTAARRDYEANPESADAIIWLGRRLAYLGRYREAIDVFSEGIGKHPDDARLYRHRGHRYITLRRFKDAETDLEKAAALVKGKPDEVEADGLPNARNIPLSSLQSNIYYHLGLAYYLQGDFDRALRAYQRCMQLAKNADRLVSTSNWLYMTLRRMGRPKDADKVLEPISTSMDVIENVAYHKLLLMYDDDIAPEELEQQDATTTDGATILYGIGNWYFYNGEPEKAWPIWQQVIDANNWSAFGAIAAESEIARK
jgi:tetratricopeptide (TPR) repeat protein